MPTKKIVYGISILIIVVLLVYTFSSINSGGGGGGDGDVKCQRGISGTCPDNKICDVTSGSCIDDGSACTSSADCNGYTCTSGKCQCDHPYTGKNCKQFCDDTHPCENQGTCTQTGTCKCQSGYSGDRCEIIPLQCTEADSATTCGLHGSCINNVCVCKDYWQSSDDKGVCSECKGGYGPSTDYSDGTRTVKACSLKFYDMTAKPTTISLTACHDSSRKENKLCWDSFGPNSQLTQGDRCKGTTGCKRNLYRYQCDVKKYYASPTFDSNTYQTVCDSSSTSDSTYRPPGFLQYNN